MSTESPEARSRVMRAVRRSNTGPEVTVRKMLHGMGYRYRLHDRRLPGTPDIIFPSRRRIIFVHGCFWHGHECRASLTPKTRTQFWRSKICRNSARDEQVTNDLEQAGWNVMVVWECQLRKSQRESLINALRSFLGPPGGVPRV